MMPISFLHGGFEANCLGNKHKVLAHKALGQKVMMMMMMMMVITQQARD